MENRNRSIPYTEEIAGKHYRFTIHLAYNSGHLIVTVVVDNNSATSFAKLENAPDILRKVAEDFALQEHDGFRLYHNQISSGEEFRGQFKK